MNFLNYSILFYKLSFFLSFSLLTEACRKVYFFLICKEIFHNSITIFSSQNKIVAFDNRRRNWISNFCCPLEQTNKQTNKPNLRYNDVHVTLVELWFFLFFRWNVTVKWLTSGNQVRSILKSVNSVLEFWHRFVKVWFLAKNHQVFKGNYCLLSKTKINFPDVVYFSFLGAFLITINGYFGHIFCIFWFSIKTL